ncbi:phosphate/phosphite/phosphonate ABC transporter substrate-binding protein [Geobacter sp. AOG1]|uniref:substrate-binding domain-containing protein n=1 Tax=Geobacter sp. AOG1 TaxID=1566346 RepID=UPI001CC5DAC1|nr:phosphate/phosphite/phosphonate ABC transporter substrate-binding protein [Geobacter sp. AOG1]GFE58237.1 phosphonate ABC transporter substrate-binding protein [Geobacter sp. AOG1]
MLQLVTRLLPCHLAILSIVTLIGCSDKNVQEVRLEQQHILKRASSASVRTPLRLGMGAMITPKEGYVYYRQLKDYLEDKVGQPIQLVDRENYDQINKLLESGGLDVAFICAGPYVEGHEKFDLELLAVPLVHGKPAYHSYIIVPQDSPVHDFAGLRGKSFAFADPKSNSGCLVPTYMLSRMGETPHSFFSKHIYTYGHDKSINAVARKMVDGAAVDSLIWEYIQWKHPDLTAKTRIVTTSPPYGIPPLVVRAGVDPATKHQLREILLHMHETQRGREILAGMMVDRFADGNDRDYDSIREMNAWIARRTVK